MGLQFNIVKDYFHTAITRGRCKHICLRSKPDDPALQVSVLMLNRNRNPANMQKQQQRRILNEITLLVTSGDILGDNVGDSEEGGDMETDNTAIDTDSNTQTLSAIYQRLKHL